MISHAVSVSGRRNVLRHHRGAGGRLFGFWELNGVKSSSQVKYMRVVGLRDRVAIIRTLISPPPPSSFGLVEG